MLEACYSYYKLVTEIDGGCAFRDVARRLWPNLQNHKLPTVCRELGISIVHHDGLSDARLCSILAAYQKSSIVRDSRFLIVYLLYSKQGSRNGK